MGLDSAYGIGSLKPGVCTSSTRPSVPYTGQTIFETDTNRLYVYNSSAWVIPNSPAQNPTGLELVSSTAVGTAVSTVTVSNAFSATYDTYRVVWSGGVGSVSTGLGVRVGGATTYYSHMLFWQTMGVAGVNSDSNSGTTQVNYIGSMTTNSSTLTLDVINPYISTLHTTFTGGSYIATDFGVGVGRHNTAQSNTSVTILPLSGTMTGGTIYVYGYRKS